MTPRSRHSSRRAVGRSAVTGVLVAALTWTVLWVAPWAPESASAASEPGSSAVTVTTKDQDPHADEAPMPGLEVTVSQTKHLVAQGIRITWKGGATKSVAPSANNGGENFLQVFMCWGDDPEDASRPDRTTCQYGGANTPGSQRDGTWNRPMSGVPAEDRPYTAPNVIPFLPAYTGIPFVARDGDRVDGVKTDPATGATSIDPTVNLNVNKFFTGDTTNEIPWAGSGDDGKGSVAFEVQTAAQSTALGCGTAVTTGATTTGASCWLVILPRGTSDNGATNITQSGLFIESWRHALAVRLDFEPITSSCPEGAAERLLAGSELTALAVNSWQPVVCNQEGGSVYSLLTIPETDAVSAAATVDGAPLALTSYPWGTSGDDPLKYAPVALTGISITLAIDRRPDPFKEMPDEYRDAAHTAFTKVNLTPRLLAKLLTYSYLSSLPTGADTGYITGTNPYNITKDPDFLAVNDDEWAAQDLQGPAIADVIVPQGRSDAARAVWAYLAADPEARDFLAGKPDPWGMVVNPWYSTDADTNLSGAAFALDRDDFPKADPIEYTPPGTGPINLVTWRPFAADLASVAYLTLRGDSQGPGQWDPNSNPPKFGKRPRMSPGDRAMLGITSTPAAARYQVITASLENPAGKFVAPTTGGMLAAASVMGATDSTQRTLGFDAGSESAKGADSAYPLTLPVYAAASPLMTDATLRKAYADFIRFASGTGQTPGSDVGRLPDGYAPIPAEWAATAATVAAAIEAGPVSAATPPSTDAYVPATTDLPPNSAAPPAAGGIPPTGDVPATDPAATGAPASALSAGTTPDDPEVRVGGVLPISILVGAASAIVSLIVSRRRAIRTWARR